MAQRWTRQSAVDSRTKFKVDHKQFVSEAQSEFIDWLLDPERQGSQVKWAEDRGMSPATVSKWKKEPFFRMEWQERADKLNGGIERTQQVIDALFEAATVGKDTKAMSLYLQYIDKFTPKRVTINEDHKPEELSDEQLAAAIASLRKES